MTLSEIVDLIATNTYVSEIDGLSNNQRVAFICRTLGVSSIDLTGKYPFDAVMSCSNVEKVKAIIYVAMLQHQFTAMASSLHHMDAEEGELKCAFLHLWILKMQWHLKHLEQGEVTPPFPFIH